MSDLDQSPAQPFELLSRGPTFGNLKNYNLLANGPPGGANGNVQYNNAGIFGGLTNTQLTSLLDPFTSVLKGAVPASGGGTSKFLRADGTFQVPSSTGSFDFFINVKDFGATGNGSTDDTAAVQAAVDAAFGPASSPHGNTSPTLNKILFFPPGTYVVSSILFTKVFGGIVKGAGRFATRIERLDNTTPTLGLFRTNGCSYTKFEDMDISGPFHGICFDLDWDSTAGSNLQSNTFSNIYFDLASHGADYGVRIAHSGGSAMGSENLFQNCFWVGNGSSGQYGMVIQGQNALQNTILGGNFQSLDYGIWIQGGSVNNIAGTGFQESTSYDIRCNDDITNTMTVIGCRSESNNFIISGLAALTLSGCQHTGVGVDGDFLYSLGAHATIDGCISNQGRLLIQYSSRININNSGFGRNDFLQTVAGSIWSYANGNGQETCIQINNSDYGSAPIKSIRKLEMVPDNTIVPSPIPLTRQQTSAGALTDGNITGFAFNVGDMIWQNAPVAGGSPGWVCTTAGTAGSTAVFKAMANLAA